jgi:signal peptidase I
MQAAEGAVNSPAMGASAAAAIAPDAGQAKLARAIRALWFGLVPVLAAGVAFRYLVPSANAELSGPLGTLAELGARYPVLLSVGFYLLFASLVRYWAPSLPGAESWLVRPAQTKRLGRKELSLWVGMVLLAVVAALGLRTFYRPYRVLSGSMLPTFEPGAHVLSTNAAYQLPYLGGAPRVPARGDVVVFKKDLGPGYPDELVKRVVGLPGDSMVVRRGYAFINGWKVPSCDAGLYVYASATGLLEAKLEVEFLGDRVYLTAHSNAAPAPDVKYTVPAGEVFLLGDNRNNSSDSRSWNAGRGGSLPLSDIRGRVDRLLVGARRNGDADTQSLFRPLGLEPNLEGMDSSGTRARIETCLKARPTVTVPPATPPGSPVLESLPESTP